jgi:hypothetical protein
VVSFYLLILARFWRELYFFSEAIFRLRARDLTIRNPNAIWYHRHHYNLRIYSPIKNSEDHDPEGVFIKKMGAGACLRLQLI